MSTQPPKKPSANRRYQFTLATLLLIVFPVSLLAGTWAGLVDFNARATHLLIVIAAPMGILIVLSIIRAFLYSSRPRK